MEPPPWRVRLLCSTAPSEANALKQNSKWACERWSPLICPNEDLVNQLRIIKEQRNLNSNSRDDRSSYIACASALRYSLPPSLMSAQMAGL